MNKREVDDALSAANPFDPAEAPPPTAGEREFLAGVMSEAQQPDGRSSRRRRGSTTMAMTLGAIGVGALAFLFLGNSGSGPAGPPASAYAAELARITEDSSKDVVVIEPPAEGGEEVVVSPPLEVAMVGSEVVITKVPEDSYLKAAPGGTGPSDHGWTLTAAVWDCTDLPCVQKNVEEARRTGLISDVELKALPPDTEVVVPPAGD